MLWCQKKKMTALPDPIITTTRGGAHSDQLGFLSCPIPQPTVRKAAQQGQLSHNKSMPTSLRSPGERQSGCSWVSSTARVLHRPRGDWITPTALLGVPVGQGPSMALTRNCRATWPRRKNPGALTDLSSNTNRTAHQLNYVRDITSFPGASICLSAN